MMLKKCFGGIQKYTYCKKWFLDHINEIPPPGGRELICHAISLHPLPMRNMHRTKQAKNMWKYQYEDRYSPSQVADAYKNNQEMYISHALQCWQMNYVENLYWGCGALHILQKIFVEHFNEMPSSWGSSAMPCHFTHYLCQAFQL